MAKSNKHKLLHTGLIVIGVLLFIIALWAIVVPHYTCKDGGDCQWSFIGTNYSCDTCHKKKESPNKSTAPPNKSTAPVLNDKIPEKKETVSQNPYPTQSDSCYNNCSSFYDNDWRLYNRPYYYGTYSPYYSNIANPYPFYHRRNHRQKIIKNINNNVFQMPRPPPRPSPGPPRPPPRPSPGPPRPPRPSPSPGSPPSGPPGPPPSGPPLGSMPSDKTDSFVQTF